MKDYGSDSDEDPILKKFRKQKHSTNARNKYIPNRSPGAASNSRKLQNIDLIQNSAPKQKGFRESAGRNQNMR
jgi:hypothetical protein